MTANVAKQAFIDSHGLRIATYSWGGSGTPILLAHPTGFHGRLWGPTASLLVDAGHAVYSFDFRGHGDSDASTTGYAWTHFADDVTAVADHFELSGRSDLIAAGHSKGAASLLLAELAQPGTFMNVWAYEPIMFPRSSTVENGSGPLARGARRRRNEWASLDEAYDAYRSKPPLDVMTDECLHAYVDHAFRDRGDGVLALKCDPLDEAQMYENGATNGLFEQLDQLTCRVHLAVGENSDAITPRFGEIMVAQLRHAELEVWSGRGHFGPQQDPQRAAASILASESTRP